MGPFTSPRGAMFLATAALMLSLTAIPTRAHQTRAGTSIAPTGRGTSKRGGGSAGVTTKQRRATRATTPDPVLGDGAQSGSPRRRGRPPKMPKPELSVEAGAASVSPSRVEENQDPQQDRASEEREPPQNLSRTPPRAGSPPPGTPLVLRDRGPDEELRDRGSDEEVSQPPEPIDASNNEAEDASEGEMGAAMNSVAVNGDTDPSEKDEEGALPSRSLSPAEHNPPSSPFWGGLVGWSKPAPPPPPVVPAEDTAEGAADGDTELSEKNEEGEGGALPSMGSLSEDMAPAEDTAGAGEDEMQEGGLDSPSRQGGPSRDGEVTHLSKQPLSAQPHSHHPVPYRGTSLIKNTPLIGPYSRTTPRVLWWS